MPLPKRFWQLDVKGLRAECSDREIDPEGLSRNEMREAIQACEKEEEVNIEIEKLKLEMKERERERQANGGKRERQATGI